MSNISNFVTNSGSSGASGYQRSAHISSKFSDRQYRKAIRNKAYKGTHQNLPDFARKPTLEVIPTPDQIHQLQKLDIKNSRTNRLFPAPSPIAPLLQSQSPPVQSTEADDDVTLKSTYARINVSGRLFIIRRSKLLLYPEHLLGSEKIEKYYDKERDEYFLDRNSDVFTVFYEFYNYGYFKIPHGPPMAAILDEIEFLNFHFELNEEEESKTKTKWEVLKEKIWYTANDPGYSVLARVYNVIDVFIILVATAIIIMETDPHIAVNKPVKDILIKIDIMATIYFTLELLTRFIVCPDRLHLTCSSMTWIDFLAVFPFYLEHIIISITDAHNLDYLAVVRLGRIFRIFKLIKRNQKLRITFGILITITSDLIFLFSIWFINVVFFGVAIYYFENTGPALPVTSFSVTNAADGCWLAVVTLSTVGYGDKHFITPQGRLLGTCVVAMGMVFFALPLSIIYETFLVEYERYFHYEATENDESVTFQQHMRRISQVINEKLGDREEGEPLPEITKG